MDREKELINILEEMYRFGYTISEITTEEEYRKYYGRLDTNIFEWADLRDITSGSWKKKVITIQTPSCKNEYQARISKAIEEDPDYLKNFNSDKKRNKVAEFLIKYRKD